MLEKVIVKNYKSLKNETIIDFTADKYAPLSDTHVKDGMLKGLFFFGANSSGKSNILDSIRILLELLFLDKSIDFSFQTCLFSNENIELEYFFRIDSHTIDYFIEINKIGQIVKEVLKDDLKIMLKREENNVETILTDTKHYNENSVDDEMLFLRNIYFNTRFAGFPELIKWFQYLQNSIYIHFQQKKFISFSNKIQLDFMENTSEEDIKLINDFFKQTHICEEVKYTNRAIIGLDTVIDTGDRKNFYIKSNDSDYWFPLFLESQGIQDLMRLLPIIIHIIHHDGLLIMDGFSLSLHNGVEELLINYLFQNIISSQVIVATHSTHILKNSLIRPDQLYAVDFQGNEGTFITKFSKETPRTSQNLEKMYLSGIFGGIINYK